MTCGEIYVTIDNKFAVFMPIDTEGDFKCDNLFRMCFVETNLVTSGEFQPIRCTTMLCHFGRTRNVYVATRFIHYPRFIQAGTWSFRNDSAKVRSELLELWNGLGKKLGFSPAVDLFDGNT